MGKRAKGLAAIAGAAILAAAAFIYFHFGRDPLNDAPKLARVADDSWPRLPPGVQMGQATGLAADSKGRIFVFQRAGREWVEPFPKEPITGNTVFVFDGSDGKLLARWGAGEFIMPHGLAIDRDGNVWSPMSARSKSASSPRKASRC